jgi:hypothetical protein
VTTILINPPPQSHKCEVCGEVKNLRKYFRNEFPFSGMDQIGASWECEECWNHFPDELVSALRMDKLTIEQAKSMDSDAIDGYVKGLYEDYEASCYQYYYEEQEEWDKRQGDLE